MALTQVPSSMLANAGAELGMRNRIINGACMIAQRGAVAAVNNTLTYGGCDRIGVAPVSFTTISGTIQQQNAGFGSVGLSQAFTGVTSTGSGSIQFVQRIESANCKDLNSKTVTVQAKVYQNTGSALNCGFVVSKPGSVDNFASPTVLQTGATTSVPSGTLTTITTSFTFGASDCGNGLQFMAQFTGVGAITSKDFHITDFQVESGSVATPFEIRPYGMELALCQRYYEKSYDDGTAPGTATIAGVTRFPYGAASSGVFANAKFKVTKRAIPSTVRTWDEAGNLGRMSFYNAGSWALTNNLNALASNWGGANEWGFSASTSTAAAAGSYTVHWDASAEL